MSAAQWTELTNFKCPASGCPSKEDRSWVCEEDGTTILLNAEGKMKCQNGNHKGDVCKWVWNCGKRFHRGQYVKAPLESFTNALSQNMQSLDKMGTIWWANLVRDLDRQYNSPAASFSGNRLATRGQRSRYSENIRRAPKENRSSYKGYINDSAKEAKTFSKNNNASREQRYSYNIQSEKRAAKRNPRWFALKNFSCPVLNCPSRRGKTWVCDMDGSTMFVNAFGKMECEHGTHTGEICTWVWNCGDRFHLEEYDTTCLEGFTFSLSRAVQLMAGMGSEKVACLINNLGIQFDTSSFSGYIGNATRAFVF
ncbi:uncharacterized protein LOC127832210 isoform X2 [Dreissena polymorpha]|uniref:uncharacterized protein LOC127832210 isoform X2 n=1 Tax=Dreissena polymorpha TaxID=45954 RepID=UPI002264872C|nr:uncharacterized protein LOC127832210 isoform X2 [Dreissena polymorpha]